jgi:predicted CXXCH cytochrome family protein
MELHNQIMGRLVRIASVSALLLGLLGLNQSALAGIANTKHNLGTGAPAGQNRVTAGTDEICVFCHTPHAADTSAPVPLWNKALPSGAGYTTYASLNSSTIDGAILSVGSVSLACLSCHDGTQAMDNIINAPGSGGYDATGGGAGGLAYTWDTSTGRVNAQGVMQNASNTLAMLGTDLSNDHPIGIQYCGGGPNATNATAACRDTDFKGSGTGLQNATINTNLVWWVDTAAGTAGQRDKTDMILYTRSFSGTNGPSVECASCHDPHSENSTFLRIANTGSAVCLACHVK